MNFKLIRLARLIARLKGSDKQATGIGGRGYFWYTPPGRKFFENTPPPTLEILGQAAILFFK